MAILARKSAFCVKQNDSGHIPKELTESQFWSGYKLQPDQDPTKKDRKIPYDVHTGQNAKINDPATLARYDLVAKALACGLCDGMNYAFGHDSFIGIDLDGVIKPETGQIKDQFAESIYQRFLKAKAYIELSPSRTGIRIVCKGQLPRFGKGRGSSFNNFEVYGKGDGGLHFLSISGFTLHAVDEIPVCQNELDEFYETYIKRPEAKYEPPSYNWENSPALTDEEVITKLRRSKRCDAFSELFDHGSSGDHSTDDLILCGMIAFYTQSPEQIDEIFRQSALNRAKWEDRADYREMTIKKALVGLTSTWQLRQPRQHWQPESAFFDGEKKKIPHVSNDDGNFFHSENFINNVTNVANVATFLSVDKSTEVNNAKATIDKCLAHI